MDPGPVSPGAARQQPAERPGAWPAAASRKIASPGSQAPIRIHDIQGAAHLSPLAGQMVAGVQGMLTAVHPFGEPPGFYLQEPIPDGEIETSEGIFVSAGLQRLPAVGDVISVTATVVEDYQATLYPGGLSVTRLFTPTFQILSHGAPLPAAAVLGAGGRTPPNQVIDDDATGNVENSGTFDPETDGIDFYESVEGMRVQVNDAMVLGDNSNRQIFLVADAGLNTGMKTARGGLIVRVEDWNPERMLLDDVLVFSHPNVDLGDGLNGPIIRVVDCAHKVFLLYNTVPLPLSSMRGCRWRPRDGRPRATSYWSLPTTS